MLPTALFVSQQPYHEGDCDLNRLSIFLTSAVDMYAHLWIRDHPVGGVYMMLDMKRQALLAFSSSEDDVSSHLLDMLPF